MQISSNWYQRAEYFRNLPTFPVFTLATPDFADQNRNHQAVHGHASLVHADRRLPRVTAWLHRAFASPARTLPLRPVPDLPIAASPFRGSFPYRGKRFTRCLPTHTTHGFAPPFPRCASPLLLC